MIRDRPIVDRLMPWAGLAGAILGGGLSHQIGSENLFRDCAATGTPTVLFAAALGFLIVGIGAFFSWTVLSGDQAPSRRLVAGVSLITAALVAFSILLPTIYSLIVPACFA